MNGVDQLFRAERQGERVAAQNKNLAGIGGIERFRGDDQQVGGMGGRLGLETGAAKDIDDHALDDGLVMSHGNHGRITAMHFPPSRSYRMPWSGCGMSQ